MLLLDLALVGRAGVLLDGPKVQVAVLPEQLLQLQSVLDLLAEDLQHTGAGSCPCPHISKTKYIIKKYQIYIFIYSISNINVLTHLPVRARGARFLGSSDNGDKLEAGELGEK